MSRRAALLAALLLPAATCEVLELSTEGGLSVHIVAGSRDRDDRIELRVGETITLDYEVRGVTAGSEVATWESRDPDIARFVAPDRLLGVRPGFTEITVLVRSRDRTASESARVQVLASD